MKTLFVAALVLLALAAPARASDPYFVTNTTAPIAAGVASTSTFASHPLKWFSLQVTGTTTAALGYWTPATAWSVVLEGSLDGYHYTPILSHGTNDGDGVVKVSSGPAALFPVTSMRTRVISVTRGTANAIKIDTLGSQ